LSRCNALGDEAADLTLEYLRKEKDINSLKQSIQDDVDNGTYS
jgi:hypothetical protein